MPSRDRPEDKLPARPGPGGTRTDLKATEPTKVSGPLITADESDEAGDDDEPLFSDEAPPPKPRFADSVVEGDDAGDEADDDDEQDDDDGFLAGRTIAEVGVMVDGPTRVTVTPQADPSVPVERTIVSPLDLGALRDPARDESSDFDAPTTLSGEEVPGTSPTASSPAAAPVGPDDETTRQPASPAPAIAAPPAPAPGVTAPAAPASSSPSPLAAFLAALPPLSPAAYMGVGFAAASLLAVGVAVVWSMAR